MTNKIYLLRDAQAKSFLNLIGRYDPRIKEVLFDMFNVRSLLIDDNELHREFKQSYFQSHA